MKKLYLFILFAGFIGFSQAQDDLPSEKKQQNIEALKVAFISKELELTPDEAQKFWPLYNQYSKELKTTIKDDVDVLDRDEKVLNLRKRYKDQFTKVLGQQRMNRIFNAEGRFRQLLIKSMRNQNLHNKANRQLPRRG
ncbi:MAG: hypothetical protein H7Z13_13170 [Ferruginibacter sp.]|nr:hypothetical protein [Ferruginibacter sp.]